MNDNPTISTSNSLTDQIQMTDEQINAAFAAIGCEVEVSGDWGEPECFTVTADTLDDFRAARSQWNKPGYVDRNKSTDSALVLREVAAHKGDPRHDLYIVDFGAVRVACRF